MNSGIRRVISGVRRVNAGVRRVISGVRRVNTGARRVSHGVRRMHTSEHWCTQGEQTRALVDAWLTWQIHSQGWDKEMGFSPPPPPPPLINSVVYTHMQPRTRLSSKNKVKGSWEIDSIHVE